MERKGYITLYFNAYDGIITSILNGNPEFITGISEKNINNYISCLQEAGYAVALYKLGRPERFAPIG